MTQPTTPETPADAGTPTPFEVGLQLRWSDEDRYGHVNNARLLTLTEELLTRENVSFLAGTFLSNVGLAVSDFANQRKVLFLATEPLTDALTMANA